MTAQSIKLALGAWLERMMDEYPLLFALAMGAMFLGILWWLSQPMELIYDPNAPPAYEKWDPNR